MDNNGKKIYKPFIKALWWLLFKLILFPLYKLFLNLNKLIHKNLIHTPYLTQNQIKNTLKQNFPFHITISIILIFVIANNLATQNTYAEDFNKQSIMASILMTDIEQEIVEKSYDLTNLRQQPKTESIHQKLSTLSNISYTNSNDRQAITSPNETIISQNGQTFIKPSLTPIASNQESKPVSMATTKDQLQNKNNNREKEIKTYIVQPGDTISAIAEKFGISINTILWENNLSLSSYIRPGDKLTILPVDGISYTIRSGDTLSAIANKYNSDLDKILAHNQLASAGKITAGQKLIIPDGKPGSSQPQRTHSIYNNKIVDSQTQSFIWPSNSKRITQYYHWRHYAIDIGAKSGTPIYASKNGRIEYSGWSTGYGYNIVVNHGSGSKTRYAHASRLYVKRGDQVSQGEVIGAVGSTGWSTGPHIHFEIIINNTKVNPLSYL